MNRTTYARESLKLNNLRKSRTEAIAMARDAADARRADLYYSNLVYAELMSLNARVFAAKA